MTFSALLDRTTRLYRANFRPLVTVAAIVTAIQLPLAVLAAPTRSGVLPEGIWTIFALAGIAAFLTTPIMMGGVCFIGVQVLKGRSVSAGEALRAALGRYGTLFLFWMGASLLIMLGMILLVVPGIYIAFGLALGVVAIMDEGLGASAGMKRSWALMKKRRLRVLGLTFVWAILQTVTSYALGGVLRLILPDNVGTALGQQIAATLLLPCWGLSLALIFEHAKLEREGHDLVLDAQRLAEGNPSGDPALHSAR